MKLLCSFFQESLAFSNSNNKQQYISGLRADLLRDSSYRNLERRGGDKEYGTLIILCK